MRSLLTLVLTAAMVCGLLGWLLADPYGFFLNEPTMQTPEWRLLALGAVLGGLVIGCVSTLVFAAIGSFVACRSSPPSRSETKRTMVRPGIKLFGSALIVLSVAVAMYRSISSISGSTRSEGFGNPPIFERIYSYTQEQGRVPIDYGINWGGAATAMVIPSLIAFIGGYTKQKSS